MKKIPITAKGVLLNKCISKYELLLLMGWRMDAYNEYPLHKSITKFENIIRIGETYVTTEKMKELKHTINNIVESCLHGINGTTPEYYDEVTDGKYCPHEDVLYYFTEEGGVPFLVDLDEDIRSIMSNIANLENTLSRGFRKFFPDIQMYSMQEDGGMKQLTNKEIAEGQEKDYFNNLELSSIEMEWSGNMREIKKIAENKGSLGKIIELL